MNEYIVLDAFDRKIIGELQVDGRLTNNDLAERVGLSSSQCSRRRIELEKKGVIKGYHAQLDPKKIGIGIICMISINMTAHNDDSGLKLQKALARMPNVQEAYALTGEMDYSIKVAVRDLEELNEFINKQLLSNSSIQSVKTSIVLNTIKQSGSFPV